jgi:DnaK suppressor protein
MYKNNKFLTQEQISHFEKKLKEMREEIIRESEKLIKSLDASEEIAEYEEQAALETEFQTDCSILEQEQQMLWAINNALEKIQNGSYGYCEETGEPIDIQRLEAYPMATLSIEGYKERKRISLYGGRASRKPHF